jgi:hypothetical protein
VQKEREEKQAQLVQKQRNKEMIKEYGGSQIGAWKQMSDYNKDIDIALNNPDWTAARTKILHPPKQDTVTTSASEADNSREV